MRRQTTSIVLSRDLSQCLGISSSLSRYDTVSVILESAGCDMSMQTRLWLVEAAGSFVAGPLGNSCVSTNSLNFTVQVVVSLRRYFISPDVDGGTSGGPFYSTRFSDFFYPGEDARRLSRAGTLCPNLSRQNISKINLTDFNADNLQPSKCPTRCFGEFIKTILSAIRGAGNLPLMFTTRCAGES